MHHVLVFLELINNLNRVLRYVILKLLLLLFDMIFHIFKSFVENLFVGAVSDLALVAVAYFLLAFTVEANGGGGV